MDKNEKRKEFIERMNLVYRNTKEIHEYLLAVAELDKKEAMGRWFKFEQGRELILRVRVEDPELVEAMLGSSHSDYPLMPGMDVLDVRFKDLGFMSQTATHLREIADLIDNGELKMLGES